MFSSIPLKKENLVEILFRKVFFSVMLLLVLSFTNETKAQSTADSLFIPTNPADLGVISEGDTIHTQFVIYNLYSDTLSVQQVVGTCGCTVPTYEKQYLAPNDSMIVTFHFNSKGFKYDVVKNIRILSSKGMSIYEFKVFVKPKEE